MISLSKRVVTLMFGEGASFYVGLRAKALGITKAIVVCDKGVRGAGMVDPLLENLNDAGVKTVVFDGVLPDPPDYMVEEAGRIACDEKIDGIIGIGGGSSLDTAKAVNILINNGFPIKRWAAPAVPPAPGVPLITIPTSAGTGSEVTNACVITDSETQNKAGYQSDQHCYASLAIVDPNLYVSMPIGPSIACGFDAYTHAIDAICSLGPEALATTYATEAIRLIHRSLPRIKKDPGDLDARGDMAYAATLGGYAINSSPCHATHTVGHTLGSKLHLAHGIGCAACLPQILRKYAAWLPKETFIVGKAMGCELPEGISSAELGKAVSEAALNLMRECGLPTLKELGYTLEEILALAPLMPNDMSGALVPRLMTVSEYVEMLTEAYDIY